MQEVAFPAEVKGVGELGRVLFVEVVLITPFRALPLHLLVCHLHGGMAGVLGGETLLALFGTGDSGEGVCVEVDKVLRGLRHRVSSVVHLVERLAQGRQVACLLQTLDRGLTMACQPNVPACEDADDETNDTTHDSKHNEVNRQQRVEVLRVIQHFGPHPCPANGKGVKAEERSVDQEEQESLVVPEADASGEPRAMVVHLEHAAAARRAVVRAVGLAGLALLAEPDFAIAFNSEGGRLGRLLLGRREKAVAIVVGGRAGGSEDGGGIGPVEKDI